jgi:hypothetical protein
VVPGSLLLNALGLALCKAHITVIIQSQRLGGNGTSSDTKETRTVCLIKHRVFGGMYRGLPKERYSTLVVFVKYPKAGLGRNPFSIVLRI